MSDQDDTQGIALAVAMVVAALVVAGVLGLAVMRAPTRADTHTTAAAADEALGPVERIEFEPGSAALPPDSTQALQRAAESARADGGLAVLVLPFQAASADASARALAESRARAVRHALEANGVPPQQIIIARPEPVLESNLAPNVDRVELRLQ